MKKRQEDRRPCHNLCLIIDLAARAAHPDAPLLLEAMAEMRRQIGDVRWASPN